MAVVKKVIDKELVKITYVVEPSKLYEINIKELLNEGSLKVDKENELEQFYEIGALIRVKWSKEEIGDSSWRPGWYTGEVQGSDSENDLITVQFITEIGATYTYEVTTWVSEGKMEMVNPVF